MLSYENSCNIYFFLGYSRPTTNAATTATTTSSSLMQIQQTANYASATRLTAYWQNATITATVAATATAATDAKSQLIIFQNKIINSKKNPITNHGIKYLNGE